MPTSLSGELRCLLVLSTHRIAMARDVASKYLNRLITSFPSLMCDSQLVFAILEALTLLQRACDNEFVDEVGSTRAVPTDFTNSPPSTTLSTSTIRTEAISPSSSPTAMTAAPRFSCSLSAMLTSGLSWRLVGHQWNSSLRCKWVDLPEFL
jgi:hypothetical protein